VLISGIEPRAADTKVTGMVRTIRGVTTGEAYEAYRAAGAIKSELKDAGGMIVAAMHKHYPCLIN
jgi:hypothetical protein